MTVSSPAALGFVRAWRRTATARSSGPASFAQALLARHGQGVSRAPRLEMLVASRARAQFTLLRQMSFTFTQPSMILRDVESRGEVAPTPMGRGDSEFTLPAVWPRPISAAHPTAGPETSPMPRPSARAFVRAMARSTRVENQKNPAAAALQSPTIAARPQLIERAPAPRLGRLPDDMPTAQPRRALATTRAEIPTPVPSTPPPTTPNPKQGTAQQVLPPHEVERITEQVMSSIDRRIVAERERLGRL